jgi:phosphoribosylaminoimidazolecarboxamide formyltransferase/IMP cyclohydrolase
MKQNDGKVNENTCAVLAYEVFDHTSKYDTMISRYLATKFLSEDEKKSAEFPDKLEIMLEKIQDLRYGENSHQQAAFYRKLNGSSNGLAKLKQLHGKELSFNNIIDLEAAWKVSLDFNEPVSVIIKHTNPCGVATGQDLYSAFKLSLESDPVSAFGGIIGFNREVDDKTAVEVSKLFVEAVVAPGFSEKAIEVLKQKPSIRLIVLDKESHKKGEYDYKRVSGGMLLQNNDDELFGGELKTVTKKQPSGDELEALKFAWKVCKHVKSNAIVYAIKGQTIGIGAGQTSRVDSSELAIAKSKKNKLQIKGTVMASDAFFPFRDAVDAAAEAGVTAIIQPGGSNRDDEVIGACNEHGIAMVFTGMRHFKH